jgi:hypothetical protein
MKNNKPVAVLMDIKMFNYLDGIAEEQYWERLILERIANDSSERHSLENVKAELEAKWKPENKGARK